MADRLAEGMGAPTVARRTSDEMSANGKAKRKTSRACGHCQKAHMTCDASRPCARCEARGLEDSCVDAARKKAKYLRDFDDEVISQHPPQPPHLPLYSPASDAGPSTNTHKPAHPSRPPRQSTSSLPYPSQELTRRTAPSSHDHPFENGNATRAKGKKAFDSQAANLEYDILSSMLHGNGMGMSPSADTQSEGSSGQYAGPGPLETASPASFLSRLEDNQTAHPQSSAPVEYLSRNDLQNLLESKQSEEMPAPPVPSSHSPLSYLQRQQDHTSPRRGGATSSLRSTSTNAVASSSNGFDQPGRSFTSPGASARQQPPPLSPVLTDSSSRYRPAYERFPSGSSQSSLAQPTPAGPLPEQQAYASRAGVMHPQDIYDKVTRPYPYTEAYHYLIRHLKERFEKNDILRIVRALAIYRPSLIALQMPLSEEDEVFIEKCFQRSLIEFDKLISFSGTPTVVWRRTCEICLVGAEFCMLTEWTPEDLLAKKFIYEIMDSSSVVEYYEAFSNHAFENTTQAVMTTCVLLTPTGRPVPCTFCFTIKRDLFNLPSAVLGQVLPAHPVVAAVARIEITRMICSDVAHLHQYGDIPRDMKPESILLTRDEHPICKISDLGLARMFEAGVDLTTQCGTANSLAPEVLAYRNGKTGYDQAVDACSIGLIVYACLSNVSPFIEDTKRGYLPSHAESIAEPEIAVDFLQRLLWHDPESIVSSLPKKPSNTQRARSTSRAAFRNGLDSSRALAASSIKVFARVAVADGMPSSSAPATLPASRARLFVKPV